MRIMFDDLFTEIPANGIEVISLGTPIDFEIDYVGVQTIVPIEFLNDYFGATDIVLAFFINLAKNKYDGLTIDLDEDSINIFIISNQLKQQLETTDIKSKALKLFEANHEHGEKLPVYIELDNDDRRKIFSTIFAEGFKLLGQAV